MKYYLEFLDKYRWYIGITVLMICVVLQLHGSSIGLYSNLLGTNDITILGVNRPLRSDEWVVNTPFTIAQYYAGFPYFNDLIRANPTDVFIIYGQPVWDIATIFRPFLGGT